MSEAGQQQEAAQAQTQTAQAQAAAATLAGDPAWGGFDAETQGAFKNHGWDQKSPAEAAREALKSFRELERFMGVPKDQIARVPKPDAPMEERAAFWQRLGAGAKAEDYDFSGVKFSDGTELDDAFVSAMRPVFHAEGVPKDKAVAIVKSVVKFMESVEAAEATENTATMAREADELAKSWGSNVESNKFIANQAAAKLGLGADVLDGLSKLTGNRVVVANALLKLGQMMGEDKFVANPNSATPGIMTREQAEAEWQRLRNDAEFIKKVNAGDSQAIRQLDSLAVLRAGG